VVAGGLRFMGGKAADVETFTLRFRATRKQHLGTHGLFGITQLTQIALNVSGH
jgi:hypothetical protein